MRQRLRAGLIHLALGAAVAAAVFIPLCLLWYPYGLLQWSGARRLLLTLLAFAVVGAPLLTAIIYVPGKWGLRFDLKAIGALQLLVLAWGAYVLYDSRPVYFVFVKDRFELVRANEIPAAMMAKATGHYAILPLTGPGIVAARMPTDPAEKVDLMMSGIGGVDVHLMPRYYEPYESQRADATQRAGTLKQLRERNPGQGKEIGFLVPAGRKESDVRFLPMRVGKTDLTVLIDAASGGILRVSAFYPWGA